MPDPTIPELVARLRELHEKATPGPWSTNHRGGDISARIRGHEVQVALACGQGAMWDERDDAAAIMRANAELIAELRSSLPAILDALERGTDALARAWEEGAEAAFDAEYSGPLFGPALDEFYASNPYNHIGDANKMASDPWLPIEECGELEGGKEYLVRMKRGKLDELITELITIARWSGAEWQVRIGDAERYSYRAEDITHVHRMGPIRGPGTG